MLHKVTRLLRAAICFFLSFCLVVEYPVLAYADGGNYTTQGISTARQVLKNAGISSKAIGKAAKNGDSSVNIEGLDQPLEMPTNKTEGFRQGMKDNASGWVSGDYDPAQAGQNATDVYTANPASLGDYSVNGTLGDKSQWGNNIGYNTVGKSFNSAPYSASMYANDNSIWQSYYDLWSGNNIYVDDLTKDLNCTETVTTSCKDKMVQDCTEDACIGFDTPNATSCRVYYDDNGTIQDECGDYENNPSCTLLSEECDGNDEWACGKLSCWASDACSVPSAGGGNIGSCCAATRVYLCMDCSKAGGTPDFDWAQCPDDWKVHGKCAACLIGTANPIPVVTADSDDSSVIHISTVEKNGSKYYRIETGADSNSSQDSPSIFGTPDVKVTITVKSGYLIRAAFPEIHTEDHGWVTIEGDEDNKYCAGPPGDLPPGGTNATCVCGESSEDHIVVTPNVDITDEFEGDNKINVGIHDCGGGHYSWTFGVFDIYVTQFYSCADSSYQYNPVTNKCELHRQGDVIQGSPHEDDCKRFKDDPNCHLISSQCVKDEDGNPSVDDDGNCYLYEYRYRCCSDIGPIQKCSTSSDVNCGGLSCIGFGCRPEFDDNGTNATDAEKVSWFMTNSPFTDGEHLECVKKSLRMVARAHVDCCDLADQITVGPLTYFQLTEAGASLYRNTTVLFPKLDMSRYTKDFTGNVEKKYIDPSIQYVQKNAGISVHEPTTGAVGNTQVCTFMSSVFQYADVASFIAQPDPIKILIDPVLRKAFLKLAEKAIAGAAKEFLGDAAETAVEQEFAKVAATELAETLGTVISVVGWAIAAYQVLKLVATLLLGGCGDDEMTLAVKKKMGLCHYVGSYKKNTGIPVLFKKKEVYRVYCCYRSPSIRIMAEQVKPQLAKGWGTPKNPYCAKITPDELSQIDWSKIKMDQINAYRRKTGATTDSQIIEQGQSGGYGVQYVEPENPDEEVPVRQYQTLDDAGERAHGRSKTLQDQGFTNPN